jgi:predicted nucleic acid-binding protein
MTVFVDTSALLAVLNAKDPHHDEAKATLRAVLRGSGAFTHNYIHVEAEQLARRRLGAAAAVRLIEELLPALRTVWVDGATHDEAFRAVVGRGRSISVVDLVSFGVMRRMSVDTALAYDKDFDREGFQHPKVERRHTLSEARAPYGSDVSPKDLVSVSELATRSGRSINTIQSWRRRHADFPAPNVELAAGPIWVWDDVSAWIDRRSRRDVADVAR